MANNQAARQPAPQSGFGNWMADLGNKGEQYRRAIEAKGREVVEEAIRKGLPIVAKTTADLHEIGAKALQAEGAVKQKAQAVGHAVATIARDPHSAQAQRYIREGKNNVVAAVHGAGDAVTLGLADRGSSAVRALMQSKGDLSQWKQNYKTDMDQERAQDEYEEHHYGGARRAGEIGGTALSLLVPGADLGAAARLVAPVAKIAARGLPKLATLGVPAVARMAEASPAILKERVAAGLLSGGVGAGTQVASNFVEGRPTSGADFAAAGIGGFAQGIGGPFLGHVGTGALGGVVTAGARDVLNGRSVSLGDVATDALVGATVGGLAGKRSADWSDALPELKRPGQMTKGVLGEKLSLWRSNLRGTPATDLKERAINLPGSPRTRQDHAIGQELPVEAKFGGWRTLRGGQAEVYNQGRYARVDHFTPQDVATIASIPASQLAVDVADDFQDELKGQKLGWNLRTLLPLPTQ